MAGTPPRVAVPTQAELDTLTVKERLDVLEAERQRAAADRERRRQTRHQWINSGVLLIGVILAGGSLLVSAISWRTGQDELRTSRVAVTV